MLFQRIRMRLTLLSGGITTLILIIMTLGYLYISEKNLINNRLLSYQNNIYTITSNLEQQTVISHTWLSSLEGNSSFYISLLDNNVPFLFNTKKHTEQMTDLINRIWDTYRENYSNQQETIISYRSRYTGFMYRAEENYYCFIIIVEKDKSTLELLLIIPLSQLNDQIFRQRLLFLGIILVALISIWIFAWFFTGKLLYPIEENRQKQNQFVAAASHELRTPLAVILSCTEAILETVYSSDKLSRHISTIKSEALRMSTLLEDLLTLSSRDMNYFSVQKAPAELDTLLLSTCESFEEMAHAKNIRLSVSLPEYFLPHCDCDSGRIRQVLAILLHNAISYTPEGGTVALALSCQNDFFTLSVSDSGIGIPNEEKEKIFDRFYRSEKSRSAKGHFGLGLSIAYEITAAHQGNIKVSDTPGGGATFTVSLPAHPKNGSKA